ncbi:MAG: hypothetical protein M1836_002256 [Candelina mexicana]|nr:MAG: hypothetical protein M1836_002256 [Candelina mexicana]
MPYGIKYRQRTRSKRERDKQRVAAPRPQIPIPLPHGKGDVEIPWARLGLVLRGYADTCHDGKALGLADVLYGLSRVAKSTANTDESLDRISGENFARASIEIEATYSVIDVA